MGLWYRRYQRLSAEQRPSGFDCCRWRSQTSRLYGSKRESMVWPVLSSDGLGGPIACWSEGARRSTANSRGDHNAKLLEGVLESHGGAKNWARTTKVEAKMSLGGPFWQTRGWPDVHAGQTITPDPHRERMEFARTFDRFVFATRRRIYLRDANGVADQSFAPVTIDVAAVAVESR